VSKMANVPVPRYQKFWTDKGTTLQAEYQSLVAKYPDAEAQLEQLFKIVCDAEVVAGHTPDSVGESVEWISIVNTAEATEQATAKLHLEGPCLVPCMVHILLHS
jgi:hypothetical protein